MSDECLELLSRITVGATLTSSVAVWIWPMSVANLILIMSLLAWHALYRVIEQRKE